MIDFLLLLNLPVFVYGILAVLINWILKKDIIVADVFTALCVIFITIWSDFWYVAIGGGIYTFIACYFRYQIAFFFTKKINKQRWKKYLNNTNLNKKI